LGNDKMKRTKKMNLRTFKDLDLLRKRYILAQNIAINILLYKIIGEFYEIVGGQKIDVEDLAIAVKQESLKEATKASISFLEEFIDKIEEVNEDFNF
jgi:hypothetical protein